MCVIAVVDDEEVVRSSMRRLLSAAGYEVELFAGGEEFLNSLRASRPACVLVDGSMPGMSGREMLSRLSQAPFRVPAIVVSAHDSPEDRTAAAALGAVAFFRKPFRPNELLAAVAALVSTNSDPSPPAPGAADPRSAPPDAGPPPRPAPPRPPA